MDFQEYRTWIKPHLKDGVVISPGLTQFSEEVIKLNSNSLIQLIRQHAENKEYRNLAALVEMLRGDGFFYFDYIEEFGTILQMLLSQAIAIFDNHEVFKDHYLLWLPSGLYDIIFHQINFERYSPLCFELYYELSKRLLDPHFMPLYQSDYHESYDQCLYFIEMANREFAKKPEMFLSLWQLVELQIKEGKGYSWLEEYWPTAYVELVNGEK